MNERCQEHWERTSSSGHFHGRAGYAAHQSSRLFSLITENSLPGPQAKTKLILLEYLFLDMFFCYSNTSQVLTPDWAVCVYVVLCWYVDSPRGPALEGGIMRVPGMGPCPITGVLWSSPTPGGHTEGARPGTGEDPQRMWSQCAPWLCTCWLPRTVISKFWLLKFAHPTCSLSDFWNSLDRLSCNRV